MANRTLPLVLLLSCMACAGDDDPVETDETDVVQGCDIDVDEDGVCAEEDCDDSNPLVYPGADEIPYNGRDEDCDGEDLNDADGDGYIGVAAGGDDCNDANPNVYPGAEEECYAEIDYDCDGNYGGDDCDNDGFSKTEDCADEDPDIYPGAPDEWYDGIDSDCARNSDFDQDGDGDEISWSSDWPRSDWPDKIMIYDDDGQARYLDIPSSSDWRGLDCLDTDELIGGGLPELWDGIDRNCDGDVDIIPSRDGIRTFTGTGGVADDAVGTVVRIVDDLNGDRVPEIAVTDLAATEYAGRLYILDGAGDGRTVDNALAVVDGSESSFLGWGLEALPDLNGDGLGEVAVGAALGGSSGLGTVYVFDGADLTGGAALSPSDALSTISGGDLTTNIAVVTDIDDDGRPEIAASGTHYYGSSPEVWIGIMPGIDVGNGGALSVGDAHVLITSTGAIGGATAGHVDLTGDGVPDLITGITSESVVALFDGNSTFTSSGLIIDAADGDAISGISRPGLTLGMMEDVDGDGYGEALIADPDITSSFGSENGGKVYVVDGHDWVDGADLESISMFTVHAEGGEFYLSTSTRSGDHDDDGYPDLLVARAGALDASSITAGGQGVNGNGSIHWFDSDVVTAGGTLAPSDASATFITYSDSAAMGLSFDVGDLNGDGIPDLVTGSPATGAGAVTVFHSAF